MVKIEINITELRKGEGDETVDGLADFLRDRVEGEIDVTSDAVIVNCEEPEKAPSRNYLKVLLRKFLHREKVKEWFRVIAGREKAFIIKERRKATEEY